MKTKTDPLIDLINAWRRVDLTKPPFILPDDKKLLDEKDKYCVHNTYENFIRSKDFAHLNNHQYKFHLGLLPVPYLGNLRKAHVFLLMLNPGFRSKDYYAESRDRSFRESRIKSLLQKNAHEKFPFMGLDPRYHWKSDYWISRLSKLIQKLMEVSTMTHTQALRKLSRNLAVCEYVPYHSKEFKLSRGLRRNMGSSEKIRKFVQDRLIPRAKKGKALIVVIKGGSYWGGEKLKDLPRSKYILKGKIANRAGYMTRKTVARILAFLKELKEK